MKLNKRPFPPKHLGEPLPHPTERPFPPKHPGEPFGCTHFLRSNDIITDFLLPWLPQLWQAAPVLFSQTDDCLQMLHVLPERLARQIGQDFIRLLLDAIFGKRFKHIGQCFPLVREGVCVLFFLRIVTRLRLWPFPSKHLGE